MGRAVISKIRKHLRYDWPLHFILLFTNWLPDNVICLRFRGFLVQPFFGACGKNLRLGRNLSFYNPGNIYLGTSVYISYGCVLLSIDKIIIGNEVLFGPYVVMSAGNHTKKDGSFRYGPIENAPISIGDGTWIGSHTTILGGANIGSGCVIGSNAAVSRGDIPANAFAAGVPARVVKAPDEADARR